MQKILITILLSVITLSSACTMYRYPVQQGNLFTQEMVQQLRVGMSMGQVEQIMGTPMLVDGFNHKRWTYFYRYTNNGQLVHEYRLSLVFNANGRLQSIQGEAPTAAQLRNKKP